METLGSTQVYTNPWMAVREDAIRRADGSTGIYGVVDSPDLALVIPTDGDRLHLVEQYRYPVAGRRWEFPSGSADQAGDLTEGAPQRELEEQDMQSAWFSRAEVERMINDGTITDAKSVAAYTLLLLHRQASHR